MLVISFSSMQNYSGMPRTGVTMKRGTADNRKRLFYGVHGKHFNHQRVERRVVRFPQLGRIGS
jgi:hypothetical protein